VLREPAETGSHRGLGAGIAAGPQQEPFLDKAAWVLDCRFWGFARGEDEGPQRQGNSKRGGGEGLEHGKLPAGSAPGA
jgi:hypothetical protein